MLALDLTDAQIKKLMSGKVVRLSHEKLQAGGPIQIALTPRHLRKIATAVRNGKGHDLSLGAGEQIGGSLRGLYDAHVKPHVRPFLHRQATRLTPQISRAVSDGIRPVVGRVAARRISSAVDPAMHHVIDRVGDATQAYGIKDDLRKFHRAIKPAIRQGLKGIARAGTVALGVPMAGVVTDAALDAIGDRTGGFGLRPAGY